MPEGKEKGPSVEKAHLQNKALQKLLPSIYGYYIRCMEDKTHAHVSA